MLRGIALHFSLEGERIMRNLVSTVCVWMVMVSLCAGALAQSMERSGSKKMARSNDGSQVEVKKDEFSGVTTITLKPQKLIDSPNHLLTMSAEVKLEGKTYAGVMSVDETVLFKFDSQNNGNVDFGDEELHFLVDGEPVKGGSTASGFASSLLDKPAPGFKRRNSYTGGVYLSQLQQIAKGKNVAMRFGSIKLTLDEKLLNSLRDFARAANTKQ